MHIFIKVKVSVTIFKDIFEFYFLDVKNLSVFADLCQELQVDWAKERIRTYLETLEVSSVIKEKNPQHILVYLGIASKMNFAKAETNLVNQLHENFVITQMHPQFSVLETKAKILVARKRLWFIMNVWDIKDNPTPKNVFLNSESSGMLSILKDFNQKPMVFQYNAEERDLIQ